MNRRHDIGPLIVLAGIIGLLSLWPLVRLGLEGIAPAGSLDPGILIDVLRSESTWLSTWRSFDAALWSTLISVALGSAVALFVAVTDARAKAAFAFFFMLPLMIPPQITALSWAQLAGPSSALLQAFHLAPPLGSDNPMYSRGGIILLLGIQHAPLVFLTLRAGLRQIPSSMIFAARSCGAGPLRILLQIILPLLLPSFIAGGSLAYVSAIGNFGIPALLGIPASYTMLPTLIYRRLTSFGPSIISEVAVLSLLIGLLAFIGLAVQRKALARTAQVAVELEGGGRVKPIRLELGRLRLPAEVFAALLLTLILIIPLVALFTTSLVPAYGVRVNLDTATLGNYTEVIFQQQVTARAFQNSFMLAAGAALVLALLAIPLGYYTVWKRYRLAKFACGLAELPYALPGVVLAVACILIFLKPLPVIGIALYGTLAIIFFAYLARFCTLMLKPVNAGFGQINSDIDRAAISLGAGLMTRMLRIIAPTIGPYAAAGGILVFMTAFNELTVSALLWSSGTETLGVLVFNMDDGGSTVLASAVAVLCVLAIVVLMIAAQIFSRWLPQGVLPWAE